MSAERGARELEHTADLEWEYWAPSQIDLLRVAAQTCVGYMTGGVVPSGEDEIAVDLAGIDPPDRLVRWLNEVLFLASEGFLVADAEIQLVGSTGLHAKVTGRRDARALVRAELKSATYHDLALEIGPDRVSARVVFDV